MKRQIEPGNIMEKKKYFQLCIKAIAGELSPDEKIVLDRWLKQSSNNQNPYDEISATWQHTELHDLPAISDLDGEWAQLQPHLRFESEAIKKERSSTHFNGILEKYGQIFGSRLRPAIVLAIALLMFFAIFYILKNRSIKPEYVEIFTGNKQQTEYAFSDSSKARLNSGSSIKFLNIFSDTLREVYLTGEAFFEVTPDDRPFVVVTENSKTRVMGTQFNVWNRGTQTRVIVKNGKVRFSSLSNRNRSVELSNDQMSWIAKNSSPVAPQFVDSNYLLGWLDGRIVFEKTPLKEIIAELERSFDVTIVLEDVELQDHTITANFSSSSLETMIESICLTLGIKHKIENNRIILLRNHSSDE